MSNKLQKANPQTRWDYRIQPDRVGPPYSTRQGGTTIFNLPTGASANRSQRHPHRHTRKQRFTWALLGPVKHTHKITIMLNQTGNFSRERITIRMSQIEMAENKM